RHKNKPRRRSPPCPGAHSNDETRFPRESFRFATKTRYPGAFTGLAHPPGRSSSADFTAGISTSFNRDGLLVLIGGRSGSAQLVIHLLQRALGFRGMTGHIELIGFLRGRNLVVRLFGELLR